MVVDRLCESIPFEKTRNFTGTNAFQNLKPISMQSVSNRSASALETMKSMTRCFSRHRQSTVVHRKTFTIDVKELAKRRASVPVTSDNVNDVNNNSSFGVRSKSICSTTEPHNADYHLNQLAYHASAIATLTSNSAIFETQLVTAQWDAANSTFTLKLRSYQHSSFGNEKKTSNYNRNETAKIKPKDSSCPSTYLSSSSSIITTVITLMYLRELPLV